MADLKEYPRFVRLHESHVMREQRKPNPDFSLIQYEVAAKEHVTAGPMFAKFFVQKDGSVDVYVTDEKEEELATSPKEEEHKEEDHHEEETAPDPVETDKADFPT